MYEAQNIPPKKFRTAQAAEHFGVSQMTLWRWAQQDNFPQPLKMGRMRLYDVVEIERWLVARAEVDQ